MRSDFENKINMIDVILALCLKFPAVIALIPALEHLVTSLQGIRAEIHAVNEVYIKIIKGIAQNKTKSKLKCTTLMLKFGKAMKSYAKNKGDMELFKEMSFSYSILKSMRDANFYDLAKLILSRAAPLATELANFGIAATDATALTNAADDFNAKIPEPKSARDARKTSIKQITVLLKTASDLLKDEMDPLVYDVLSEDNESFKLVWKSGRGIINNRGPRRKKAEKTETFGVFQGSVINSVDSSIIEDAVVTIVEADLNTTTEEDGSFYFEKVASGNYTITATANTYLPVTLLQVTVSAEEETNLDIEMIPDESGGE